MRVIMVEPAKRPVVADIDNTLESLQKSVGGYIQAVYPWTDACALVCDDDAKFKGATLNRALRDKDGDIYDIVAGTFLIVGVEKDDFVSLPEELVPKYMALFKTPEVFIRYGDTLLVKKVRL